MCFVAYCNIDAEVYVDEEDNTTCNKGFTNSREFYVFV